MQRILPIAAQVARRTVCNQQSKNLESKMRCSHSSTDRTEVRLSLSSASSPRAAQLAIVLGRANLTSVCHIAPSGRFWTRSPRLPSFGDACVTVSSALRARDNDDPILLNPPINYIVSTPFLRYGRQTPQHLFPPQLPFKRTPFLHCQKGVVKKPTGERSYLP